MLLVLQGYPQISKTYMSVEIAWLAEFCELRIVSVYRPANRPAMNPLAYEAVDVDSPARLLEIVEEFDPEHIHGHYLSCLPVMVALAKKRGIGCTVRCHSYDILDPFKTGALGRRLTAAAIKASHQPECLGILAFPFARPVLQQWGVQMSRVVDCWPVIDFQRFHDRSPNGGAVMNMGSVLPKKQMQDFIELGARLPALEFNLYGMGFDVDRLHALNDSRGAPVNIVDLVQPADMPSQYKQHRWLVYTASQQSNSVGWPMSIAEAQASGVGVCLRNLRPDLREYLGPHGVLYDTLDELPAILREPPSEEAREAGFAHARRSDIRTHGHLLTDLWPAHLRPEHPDVAIGVAGHRTGAAALAAGQPAVLAAPDLRQPGIRPAGPGVAPARVVSQSGPVR